LVRAALSITLVVAVASAFAAAGDHRVGRVTHIVDGGTVDLLVDTRRVRVQLAGISAPRQGEPFGLRSRQSLVQLCGGEIATVELKGTDRNGRALGRVTCGGANAGAEQVRRGFARLAEGSAEAELAAIEAEARSAHRGLWSTQPSISPSSAK
jgi:endonuclease YncB( thermonuclease family)